MYNISFFGQNPIWSFLKKYNIFFIIYNIFCIFKKATYRGEWYLMEKNVEKNAAIKNKEIKRKAGRPPINKDLYNEDIKRRFLENEYSNLKTRLRYEKVFRKTYSFENKNNKDLFRFNLPEIRSMLYSFNAKSYKSLAVANSTIRKYIDWAIKENYLNTLINFSDLIDMDEIIGMTFNIIQTFRHLTGLDELKEIVSLCVNAQDAICFILPFYGLKTEEIEQITSKNIFGNNIVINDRVIELPDEFIIKIYEAMREIDYLKNNGIDISCNIKALRMTLDDNGDFLLKRTKGKKKQNGTSQLVNLRIKKIMNSLIYLNKKELYKSEVTFTSLNQSGMYYFLYEIERKNKKLKAEDYIYIQNRYKISGINYQSAREGYVLWKRSRHL